MWLRWRNVRGKEYNTGIAAIYCLLRMERGLAHHGVTAGTMPYLTGIRGRIFVMRMKLI